MNFYDLFMRGFEKRGLRDERRKLMRKVKGQVLEIGAGTGVNLKFYEFSKIEHLTLTDYDVHKHLTGLIDDHPYKGIIHSENADAMFLPFNSNFFDFVVVSLVFCTVEDVNKGLSEIKRVLKADGRLVFIEHGLPTDERLQPLFNGLTPVWKTIASGCHLNRDFLHSLVENGYSYKLSRRWMKTAFISGVAKVEEK